MCGISSSLYQRPMAQEYVLPVAQAYGMSFETAQGIFEAMTDWEVPEVSAFVLIMDTLYRYQQKDYGVNGDFGPWTPLSAITIDEHFVRYRTPEMQIFHDGFLAFNMSQRNREAVDGYLQKNHGVHIVTSHSCGVAVVAKEDRDTYLQSRLHKVRNYLRSRANSIGTELIVVNSLEELPTNVDMGTSEKDAYRRAWKVLSSLNPSVEVSYPELNESMAFLLSNLKNSETRKNSRISV